MQASTYTRSIRCLQLRPVCSNTVLILSKSRTFSTNRLLHDEAAGEDGAFKKGKRARVDPRSVKDWFNGEGRPYRDPIQGKPNWLGGNIPYPDNPTFRPSPPLSDVVKSSIYDNYLQTLQLSVSKSNSHEQAIRKLSEQLGISIARVEAIIRLKQYERQYQKEGKKLQSAFQRGMESYLGVQSGRDRVLASDFSKVKPIDVNFGRQQTADVDNEESGTAKEDQRSGAARRVWWEMVEDVPNPQPIVPGLIAKDMEKHRTKVSQDQQAHAGVSLQVKRNSVFTFVDTGAKPSARKAGA